MASDEHFCLTCNQTIQGLENYVHHKQKECGNKGKSTDNCSVTCEHNVTNTLYFNNILSDDSRYVKHESSVELIPVVEELLSANPFSKFHKFFDSGIFKEIDLKTFFNLIKQNVNNLSNHLRINPSFMRDNNSEQIVFINFLEQCRTFNVGAMFTEKGHRSNEISFLTKRKQLSNKFVNNLPVTTSTQNPGSICAPEISKHSNSDKNGKDHNEYSLLQRKIVTRLSTGIRKPSSRYFLDEEKNTPQINSDLIKRGRISLLNVPSSDHIESIVESSNEQRFKPSGDKVSLQTQCSTTQINGHMLSESCNAEDENTSTNLNNCGDLKNVLNNSDIISEDLVDKDDGCLHEVGSLKTSVRCHSDKDKLKSCAEQMLHADEISHVLEENQYLVECVVCRNHFHSASHLLNHIQSSCSSKFKNLGNVASLHLDDSHLNGGSKALIDDQKTNSSTELSFPIKRKRGRPPKTTNKKFEKIDRMEVCNKEQIITVLSSSPSDRHSEILINNDKVSLHLSEDEADEVNKSSRLSIRENKFGRSLKTSFDILHKNNDLESIKVECVALKQEIRSNDGSISLAIHEDKFWCNICGLDFSSQEKLDSHKISRTHLRKIDEMKSGDGTNYKCQRCGQLFYALNALQFHELNHTLADTRRNNFKKKNVLLKHEKQDAFMEIVDDKCLALYRQLMSEIEDNNGKVVCPECGKKMSKGGILCHLKQHTGSLPFKCTFCLKEYADVAVMRRHLKVHLGIMYHKCPVCSKQFGRKSTMQAHALREHGADEVEKHGVLPPCHQCCQCGRQFLQLSQLTAHMKLHDKQLKCPHLGCTSLFRYKSELAVHLQTHSTERRFLCDECGYSGKSRHQLKRHQRLHAGDKRYHCNTCDYKTTLAANLRRHERVHTGSKPYKCLYCGYSCNTQENLRKHILKTRRHAGKFVYPCQMCNYASNSAQDFQHHLETKHQGDRQILPSILVGMYQPDDGNKSKSDPKPILNISSSVRNTSKQDVPGRFERKSLDPTDNQSILNNGDSGSAAVDRLLNPHPKYKPNFPVQQTTDHDLQNTQQPKTNLIILPKPSTGISQSINTQDQLSPNILSHLHQVILPTSQSNSFLNALLQIQTSNHPIATQNNSHFPMIPLNTVASAQHPNLVLTRATDQSMNIKFALQFTNDCSYDNSVNPGPKPIQTSTAILPEQLALILQVANNKQLLGNNLQAGFDLFIPGLNEKDSSITKTKMTI